jgi:hypothetical protein
MSCLWLSIEPTIPYTQLMLCASGLGPALKARLPPTPREPRAMAMLLQALAAWYGEPLCAVLDADAQDVSDHPDRWCMLLGDLDDPRIQVEWVGSALDLSRRRDRFLDAMGDFGRARRLVTFAATGLR